MSVLDILASIKGKVLDATHFELLESAYKLQEENIVQLKSNNEALREAYALLKEKSDGQIGDLAEMDSEVKALREKLVSCSVESEREGLILSEAALIILDVFKTRDFTDAYVKHIVAAAGLKNIEAETALDELSAAGLVDIGSYGPEDGANYFLTQAGKRRVLSR